MKTTIKIMVLLVCTLLALMVTGCSSDDDPISKSGAVTVEFGSTAKADPASEVNVTFSRLALQNLSGTPSTTLVDSSTTVDVMGGDVLSAFNVPEGLYHCISMTVTGLEVVEADSTTCSASGGLTINLDQVCLQSGILDVEEDGTYTVLIDIPVIAASCVAGAPVINFDNPSIQLVP